MTIQELINKLQEFNPNTRVDFTVSNENDSFDADDTGFNLSNLNNEDKTEILEIDLYLRNKEIVES